MTVEEAKNYLEKYEKTLFALRHVTGVTYYDGVTVAPKGSAVARALTFSEISRMEYEIVTSKETAEMLETLNANKGELDEITARKVSELFRSYDDMRKIPVDEYSAFQELSVKSEDVWHDAKLNNDFESFCPYLQQMFDTVKKFAGYTDPDKDPYEATLDTYERGMTKKSCDEFFATLRKKLVPLIQKVIKNADKVDNAPLLRAVPIEKQRALSDYVMSIMKIDRNNCTIGETEHPFTTDFSKHDVRITTHYHENMFASSLFSVIHEGGHALYELHTGDDLVFSNLGTGVSMGIHESQSRFYENIIGRSREFCSLIFPWIKENLAPTFDDVTEDQFYKMINKSEPSLIRTEADELTYCLHVMVRYELEKMMFNGEITAKELPEKWKELYKEYLGVDVPDDTQGVLQDSHWACGNIGYFPSYALGSAYGAQFLHEMQKDFDVFAAVKNNEIQKINDWFERKVWKFGSMKDPVALFESVCGKFDPTYYVEYLEKKFTEIYEL